MTTLRIVLMTAALILWSHVYAHASSVEPRESILPPGMRTLTIELKRDPDVRCVIQNCFTPPVPRRGESQRRFERRLLSPAGRGRLE